MNRFENRLYTNLKSGSLNPVYDNEKEDGLNIFKIVDLLNEFDSENKKLEKENLDLSEELDYYKTKCASLETGLFQADKENERLKSICKDHRDHAIDFKADCVRLEKENEELKENCKNYNWYKQYKTLLNENDELKQELFEESKELLWVTSSEIDRVLYFEDEVEELRKEIFND